jgi:biopolymer transport protein ExbD
MPPKILFRMGLSLLFIAVSTYFATGHWLNSRIFTPLKYSVSLDTRQLKSPPFQINLRETYSAFLDLDYSADDWAEDGRCNYKTILYPQWSLYKLSSKHNQSRELWISSEQLVHPDFISNQFLAPAGRYQLEWNLPVPAACLNPRHPRLVVFTSPEGYQQAVGFTQLFGVFLGGTGLALVALATVRVLQHSILRAGALRMFPHMVLRNYLGLLRHRPMPLITQLPTFGLIYGALLWILIFIFMIVVPLPPKGLLIQLRAHDSVLWEKSPWQETLAVYLAVGEKYYVNGQPVPRDNLRAKLRQELSRRLVWTVYFEADYDTLNMNAIYAIDTIQGLGAKLVWITPRVRAKLEQERQSGAAATQVTQPNER